MVIRGECEALMNTDLNGKIQGKLNQNRKNRNTKKALLVLSLAAVIFTSTVLANPASALTEDVSGEVVLQPRRRMSRPMHREMRRLLPAILRKPWQRLPRIRA